MDASVVAERLEIAALARELARGELVPRSLALDSGDPGESAAVWAPIREVGFDRAILDPEHGGVGLSPSCLLVALEELAAGDAGVAMLVLLANLAHAALPDRPAAADERRLLAPALPEPRQVAARLVTAEREGSPTVSGRIPLALGASTADGLVILGGGPEPFVLAIETDADGVELRPVEAQLGLRAAPAAAVELREVRSIIGGPAPPGRVVAAGGIETSGRIEEPGGLARTDAAPAADEIWALLRAGVAAIARGLARRAFELAVDYAGERRQGGVPIAEHDAVRELITGMAIGLEAGRPPDPEPGSELTRLAVQTAATDAAVAITTDAVQVFGGSGYVYETGVEKLMRDAKWLQAWPEPAWFRRGLMADHLLCPPR